MWGPEHCDSNPGSVKNLLCGLANHLIPLPLLLLLLSHFSRVQLCATP